MDAYFRPNTLHIRSGIKFVAFCTCKRQGRWICVFIFSFAYLWRYSYTENRSKNTLYSALKFYEHMLCTTWSIFCGKREKFACSINKQKSLPGELHMLTMNISYEICTNKFSNFPTNFQKWELCRLLHQFYIEKCSNWDFRIVLQYFVLIENWIIA